MQLETALKEKLVATLGATFGPEAQAVEAGLELPPKLEFGDLSTPVSLKLAKLLRKKPLDIANELADRLRQAAIPMVGEITVTPPGYINFKFDYIALARQVLERVQEQGDLFGGTSSGDGKKIVIEHTNINPNKAAHIGHLRNACLGDTLARIFRGAGYQVEVQNYIDDTGTAVADIVVGVRELGIVHDGSQSFDYFCWDLYTKVNELYEQRPELKEKQREVLHLIEQGNNEVAQLAKDTSTRIVNCHLQTMWRLGIYYELLSWESDILHLGFWRHAFNTLKEQGGLVLETEGPNAGCWVVKLGDLEAFANMENPDKVLVRSNGTATYVAKDIAYQMWKFGVLGLDFNYRPYCVQPNSETLETTDTHDGEPSDQYGRADMVVNVIDIRQKYLQDVLRHSLHKLGYVDQAANSVHFGYEVVALSPTAAAELGVAVDDEEKGVYAMAGRKGIGVKADDLMNRVIETAVGEVAKRHPEMTSDEHKDLGLQIAVAAIRYYMIRYNMNSVIVFDFNEALNMQGNTGPYLQYAHARANNILAKAEREGHTPVFAVPTNLTELTEAEKNLVRRMSELPTMLQRSSDTLSPSLLADYAYNLASTFMSFYESTPVMNASDELRGFRLGLVRCYQRVIHNTLTFLGIPAPRRM